MTQANLVICRYCDSVYRRAALRRGQTADCARCGAELYHYRRADVEVMLALTLASLIAFAIANAFPIARLESQGRSSEATLWQAILGSFHSGGQPVAIIAAITVFFVPLLQIGLFAWVLLPLHLGRMPPGFAAAMHLMRRLQPWVMVEVFTLGVLVSVVKLGDVASVTPRIGTWGFAGLTLMLTVLNSFDLRELWTCAAAVRE